MKNLRAASSFASLAVIAVTVGACSKTTSAPASPTNTCSTQLSSQVCAASDPAPAGTSFTALTGNNVMPFTIGSNCPGLGSVGCSPNVPFVSVTICTPGSATQCQTVGNVLLDTGSYGLRIFGSLISGVTSTEYKVAGSPVGECAEFGSANTWGSVERYDLQIDGQTLSNFPVQQIDNAFSGGAPASSICAEMGSVSGPADPNANFNGILGVGMGLADQQSYFVCASAGHCTPVDISTAYQVQNPVPSLTTDNNGILLELPQVPQGGQGSVTGYLAFGIGTQSNNKPSNWGVSSVYKADGSLQMRTTYGSQQYSSFIDSGSNANYVPICSNTSGFLAPTCSVNLDATNMGASDVSGTDLTFQVGNANSLFGSGNWAFNNLAGTAFNYPGVGLVFDWGLPFFYGRTVFVGVTGKKASGGELGSATGPYWAY